MTLPHYRAWCRAHSMRPQAHDSIAHYLRTLTLPRPVLVQTAESICRQLHGAEAPTLLTALDAAKCFDAHETNTKGDLR